MAPIRSYVRDKDDNGCWIIPVRPNDAVGLAFLKDKKIIDALMKEANLYSKEYSGSFMVNSDDKSDTNKANRRLHLYY